MTRWNGKPDLTPVQLQERKKRRMLMRRMMFGMPNTKGTPPRQYPIGEPVWKPMLRPGLPSFELGESLGWLWHLISVLPWFGQRFRRRREAELAQERRSQSLKAKGI